MGIQERNGKDRQFCLRRRRSILGLVAEVLKGFCEFGDGFLGVAVLDSVTDTVFEVTFENDFPEFVKGPLCGIDLNEDLFTWDIPVDHFIDRIELSDHFVHSAVQIFRIPALTHCFHPVSRFEEYRNAGDGACQGENGKNEKKSIRLEKCPDL